MYYYITNPTSGRGAINGIQDKLRDSLEQLGIAGEFVKTTGPGDATRLAQLAVEKGFQTIVAVGGDETVNEVMNGVVGHTAAVGIIPIGRTNKLANQLGISTWQQSLPLLAARRITTYRLLAAGQHYFLSELTIGFETDQDKTVDVAGSKLRDRAKHFRNSWRQARKYQTLAAHLKIDDDYEVDCEFFTLSVANQKFLDPLADDRLLISLADSPNRRQLTSYLWQRTATSGAPLDHITTRLYAERLVVETSPAAGIMIDSKVSGRTPIAIRLTDQEIRFICDKPENAFRPTEKTPRKKDLS